MNLNDMPRRDRTVGVRELSPGSRSVLLRFEAAVRKLQRGGRIELEDYMKAKKAMVRRLRRLEGTLKRDGRGRPRKEKPYGDRIG